MKTLIISNKEVNDIIKIVKSIEESGLLIKSVSKTKEQKSQISWYVIMFIRH